MMRSAFLAVLLLWVLNISAQSYVVDWRIEQYDTLTDYTSILYEILEEPLLNNQEAEINFGFSFPYFNTVHNAVTIDGSGYVYFQDSENDYHLYVFSGDFERLLRSDLYSDWRMKKDTSGIDIMKIEWRNIGIYDDVYSNTPTYHYMNFQLWFYENGIIEYHFGPINLNNTPYYDFNSGFVWDDGECYGPWIAIQNTDITEFYYITGTNFNTQVATEPEDVDIFYDIPPTGRVFRFLPAELVAAGNNKIEKVEIYPVPVTDNLYIDNSAGNNILSIELFNEEGQKIFQSSKPVAHQPTDLSEVPSGFYLLKINFESKEILIKKIIKN